MSERVLQLLSKPIRRLIEEKGFKELTEPQIKAIPLILKGENLLLIAPTGTGKTEAAFLPILDMMIREPRGGGIRLIYITPLRALNRDLMDRLHWWCSQLDLRIAVRHGDTEAKERSLQARMPPDILITTPETLQAILPGKVMRQHLSHVKWVIVDEVHELAGEKRGCQLTLGLERLRRITGKDFQVVGLSATVGSPEEVAKFLVGVGRPFKVVQVPVAKLLRLKVLYPAPTPFDHVIAEKLATFPEVATRLRVMKELVEQHGSTLVFTNTRSIAEVLASRFKVWDLNMPVGIHHGSLSKPSRISVEYGLKKGEIKGVVCTSSLELGIDIGHIDFVIQYNSPRQVTRLVQRVGRSGHGVGRVSEGVVIAIDSDDALEAAVIAKKALREELEEVKIFKNPLDVLTHQLAGLLLEKDEWPLEEAEALIKKAYPFKDLSRRELFSVLHYMHNRHPRLAAFLEEKNLVLKPRPSRGLIEYYFENLSMIPEEKQFLVVDESTGTPIGVLDEAFVAEYGEPGVKFIIRGSVWSILYIHGDVIYVAPEEDPTGAVPSWVGEEIPVPFDVAQEVARIRGEAASWIANGGKIEEYAKQVSRQYPIGFKDALRALREVVEQVEKGLPVPSDRLFTVEEWEDYVIINCALGLLANRALARLLGYLAAEELGVGVSVQQDPYRVVLKSPQLTASKAAGLLCKLADMDLYEVAAKAIERSMMLKYRLIHVARRFGVLSKEVSYSQISFSQLLESVKGTAIFEEALKEVLTRDMDLETLAKVLADLKASKIRVEILKTGGVLSPISRIGMEELARRSDIIPPDRMRRIMLESTKARLLTESLTALCTTCWSFIDIVKVKDLVESFSCPECGSTKIALLTEAPEELYSLMDEMSTIGKPSDRNLSLYRKALLSARLFEAKGLLAAAAIASRIVPLNRVRTLLESVRSLDQLAAKVISEERELLKRRYHLVKREQASSKQS